MPEPVQNPLNKPTAQMRKQSRLSFYQALQQSSGQPPIPALDIGLRLRSLRSERGLTLRMLADLSGLNVNTLSMIENDRTSPSVATLQQLAFGLQLPVGTFFETEPPKQSIVFHKTGLRPKISFSHGILEELGTGITVQGARPYLVHLEPMAESGSIPIVHTGLEFVYCLEGCLDYQIGEETFQLSPGDSLLFEAHLPHRWQNIGNQPSRSILVLCLHGDDDQPARQHFASIRV
jgi:transcriptional regulator with XRE-family HTH domain